MLDPADEEVIKESVDGKAILVTWDKVLRQAAGGLTPYEALEKADQEVGPCSEAKAEIANLRRLSPEDLSALRDAGNQTYGYFREKIEIDVLTAQMIRILRVKQNYSWRSIARHCSQYFNLPFGSNQLAGMVLCEKAAKALGEDFMEPPWN